MDVFVKSKPVTPFQDFNHLKYYIIDAFTEKYFSLKGTSFNFSTKYTRKKMLEDLFLGVHTVLKVLEHDWMWHC